MGRVAVRAAFAARRSTLLRNGRHRIGSDRPRLGRSVAHGNTSSNGLFKPGRAVNEQVAKQPCERIEGPSALVVAARVTEPERRCVAAPEHDVVLPELGDDLVGPAQELGEGTFDNSHIRHDV